VRLLPASTREERAVRVIARCEMCGRIVDGVVDDRQWGDRPMQKVRPDVVVEVLGVKRTLCPSCAQLPAEEIVEKLGSKQSSVACPPYLMEGLSG